MDAEKMKEIRLGQVRWPNEIMWSDEQQAKQGWLAIVPNHELQALLDEVEALTADAERYRWLRDKADNPDAVPFIARRNAYGISQWNGAQADAAIDAARHEPKDAEQEKGNDA